MIKDNTELTEKPLCEYIGACPSCRGNITDFEIKAYKKCSKCHEQKIESHSLSTLHNLQEEIKNFIKFTHEHFHIDLTAIQINWAKKFFLNQSYSIIFPAGTGKTTFGIILATYLYDKYKKRSYIVLPSQQLLEQIYSKLHTIFPQMNILAFSKVSKKKGLELKEQIKECDFSILITTAMFLNKNATNIPKKFFDLYFVDDGDLFLKNLRNVNYLLKLMGFSDEDINKTSRLIKLKREWSVIPAEDYARQKIELEVKTKYKGLVVVASASGIPYSQKIGLFYNLLGFELGRPNIAIRKVTDAYTKLNGDDLLKVTESWLKKLGKGGLIFVSSTYGKEFIENLQEYLSKKGFSIDTYDKKNAISNLANGKLDYLIGLARYNNPLSRGIDLPVNVCYCIFVGIPKFIFNLKMTDIDKFLGSILSLLRTVFIKSLQYPSTKYDRLLKYIKKGGKNLPDNLLQIKDEIVMMLKQEENIKKINESTEAALTILDDTIKISVSDITAYLQASGRTSRLSKLGITHGLSLILSDDEKALNHLIKKIRFYIDEFNMNLAEKSDLIRVMEQIRTERAKLQKKTGCIEVAFKDSKLIIVESPHKARTIASFFGRPTKRRIGPVEIYETLSESSYICIAATKGHIIDLSHEKFFGVTKDNGIFLPLYKSLRRCPKCNKTTTLQICRKDQCQTQEHGEVVITSLRKLAQESDQIFIATDPDAEGEKIAFDIFNILYPLNQKIYRIEFHEVTKKAIFNAIEKPRNINMLAVKAQFLRRISDRWIGFAISSKLQEEFKNYNLSAGRVQTPILGWIIQKAKEYSENKIHCIGIRFSAFKKPLDLIFKFKDKKIALAIFDNAKTIKLTKQSSSEKTLNPAPPFTTDSLLQTAIRVLRKNAQQIMKLAQELYESGFITYHRTDSHYISQQGISIAKEYLKSINKEHLFKYRNNPQGTHEAIRPTKPIDAEELKSDSLLGLQNLPLSNDHMYLYDLIFKRFIASQMNEVEVQEITYTATLSSEAKTQFHVYEKILREGFNAIIPIAQYEFEKEEYTIGESDKIIKNFWTGSEVDLYTQATLIEDMKKNGLGRPSTYSPIVEKLFTRGYVFEIKNKLIPLKNGKIIYEYLTDEKKYKIARRTKQFVSAEYTAKLEQDIDRIEQGNDIYEELLNTLFKDIKKITT